MFKIYMSGSNVEVRKKVLFLAFALLGMWGFLSCTSNSAGTDPEQLKTQASVERGRYLLIVGSCNDCHTPGFMEVDGNLPESEWLTGSPVGFRGAWGTTYPSNLRIFVDETSEDDFVSIAKNRKQKPPMVWPALNRMTEEDLRAIYRFIKSLGVKGSRMPEYVSPDEEPATPYIVFEPLHMERLTQVSK